MKSLHIKFLCAYICVSLLATPLSLRSLYADGIAVDSPHNDLQAPQQSASLQFTTQNHVLNFGQNGWFASNGKYALRVAFVGANSVMPVNSSDSDIAGKRSVSEFASVTYNDIWDGINLTYHSIPNGIFESVYEVAPHAAAGMIRLQYNAPLTLNADDSLAITFETGQMIESAPIAWQDINGIKHSVAIHFNQPRDSEIAFTLGNYDPSLSLFIDPTLTWNTFLGNNNGTDYGIGIAVDSVANIYITGISNAAWGNPVRGYTGMSDAFVAKLDSSGNLLWNTFLGGGATNDFGEGIAVDGSGNVYVTGLTDISLGSGTWGNPIRAFMGQGDAFVARLDSTGNLTWNTFLGSNAPDWGKGIVVTSSGNIYVTGNSSAVWGGPIVRAYTAVDDAFVARLDSSGNLIWNSFFGGNGYDHGDGIAMDTGGNLYVIGNSINSLVSASWGNPIRGYTAGDAFVAKVDSSGNLLWNTFLGGNGNDYGYGIAIDQSGNVYATGISDAMWGNPVQGYSANIEAFVGRLDSNGNLLWNTFLGGSGLDYSYEIDADGIGNVYITGYSTASWGNPIRAYTAFEDSFVTKLDSQGNTIFNIFLGGSGSDYGYGIAIDGNGSVYTTGSSTATWESPVSAYTPPTDAFVAKLDVPLIVVSTSLKANMDPGLGNFTVSFSESVNNPSGNTSTDDVTNPNNYLLIDKGANGAIDTLSCAGGVGANDTRVTIASVIYNLATFTSRVTLADPLPAGRYRLFVCGTTSIVNLGNTALAGDGVNSGTDYVFDFAVNSRPSLPDTGFTPSVVTSIPLQPVQKAYSYLGDMWLEIPVQNIKSHIVGVPQSNHGWDVTWLGNDIGWLSGTAFPSWEGNSVLSAHVTNSNGLPGPFANIKELKYGDRVIVHIFGEKYIFEVRESGMVTPKKTSYALEHLEDHSYLTLITCQWYDPITDSYIFRRIVRAILVDVQ
jgi:LPXTG-site transpeptidase (sortase) family protein